MVTLSGTQGAHPPLDDEGFARFAGQLRHPLIADLLSHTTPATRLSGYRNTANRRYHYERLPAWPTGLLVTGDAVTTFNPLYGQGMTVAAQSALVIRDGLARGRVNAATCHRIQHALAHTADLPWAVCTTEDIRYPGALGPPPSPLTRLVTCTADRLRSAACTRPAAARAFFDAVTLSKPVWRLISPSALAALALGPHLPPLDEPPS
ncbi:hypothetical protein QZH56_24360 [Streptomyces olivoreticuli]|nr:hypothetical protein [Streptomyces olivoreticuli]WKK21932.1 hypothetical protein QZH56_24360 [Streptomyces olivoreticuli]